MRNIAMILSSGTGQRFGSPIPKQYNLIDGKMVVEYVIDQVKLSNDIDDIVFVATNMDYAKPLCEKYNLKLVSGGDTRSISIANGLDFVKNNYPNVDKIIVFDSARPFISFEIISEFLKLLNEYDAVITASKITDSLGDYENHNINRDNYYLIQAPEAFKFDIIYKYFDRNSSITSMVQQLPTNSKVYPYFKLKNNMKITYPNDLKIAEIIMKEKD